MMKGEKYHNASGSSSHENMVFTLCKKYREIVQFQGRELINGARIGSVSPLLIKLMQGGFYGVHMPDYGKVSYEYFCT